MTETYLAARIRECVREMVQFGEHEPDPKVMDELLRVAASVAHMEKSMDHLVGEAWRQSRLTEGWPTRRHLAVAP